MSISDGIIVAFAIFTVIHGGYKAMDIFDDNENSIDDLVSSRFGQYADFVNCVIDTVFVIIFLFTLVIPIVLIVTESSVVHDILGYVGMGIAGIYALKYLLQFIKNTIGAINTFKENSKNNKAQNEQGGIVE